MLLETFLSQIIRAIQRVLYTIGLCLHMNRKAHMACNFNYLYER